MRAVVLAAGAGSRLSRWVGTPKSLVPIAGRRIIDHQMRAFRLVDADVTIVVRRRDLPRFEHLRPEVHLHVDEQAGQGSMVSSLLALPLEDSHEGVVVVYGDVAFEPRILRALLQETSSDIAITLDRQWRKLWELRMSDPLSDCEEVTVREGLVESLGGPASAIETVEVQYMGLLYFSRRGLSALASEYHKLAAKGGSGPRTSMTETLGSMVQQGQRVSAQEVEGGWLELDTDEDYAAYVDAWKSGLLGAYFDSSAS